MFRSPFITAAMVLALPAVLWANEKPILTLNLGGHTASSHGLAFTPYGGELISSAGEFDPTLRFWSVKSGELVRVLHLPAYANAGEALALSPNGQLLAVSLATADKKYGIALLRLPADGTIRHLLTGKTKGIYGLAFSPDGKRLAAANGDYTVGIWDVASGRCEQVLEGHQSGIGGLAFSPDGKKLATCSHDYTMRIWDMESGKEMAVLEDKEHPTGWWNGLAWSPDGKTLVNGCYGSALRVWNADGTFRERDTSVLPYRSMVFTHDSRAVLFAGAGGGYLYDLGRKEVRAACTGLGEQIWRVALSPDDRIAATGGDKGEDLYLWDTANGKVLHRLAGTGRSPIGAAWSPDGKSVAWGTSLAGTHNWASPGPLHLTHPLERSFDLTKLDFGPAPRPDWRRHQPRSGGLSVETAYHDGGTGGEVNVKDGDRTIRTIPLRWSHTFTFLPGERLALGGWAGVKMYEARTGELLRSFQSTHTHFSLAPSPDNRYLLASEGDQTLRIWTLDREEPLLSLAFVGDEWIAWTPEGYYAASPGGEKLMGWQVNNGPDKLAAFYPAAQFRKSLYRPDVIKRLLEAGSVERALKLADETRSKPSTQTQVGQVLPPKAVITSPERSGLRLAKGDLEVKATASSVGAHPVTALRLLVDGRPYQGDAGLRRIAAPQSGDVQQSWSVQLTPGRHLLAIQAESAVSAGLSDVVEVTVAGTTREEEKVVPSLYVLAIGINSYPEALALRYASPDAQAIRQAFADKSRPLFRDVKDRVLLDKDATRKGILDGLLWLRKEMTQRDIAVIFFAGHGAKDSEGSLYLLPSDVDPDNLLATGVSGDQLKKAIAALPGRVVLMLDACHAGAVGGDRRAADALTDDLVRDLATDDYGVIVMCAAMGREFSRESRQLGHGYFTHAIIEGLSGKANKTEGAVYLHHLDTYVTDRVKELTGGLQHPVTAKPTSVRSFPLAKP